MRLRRFLLCLVIALLLPACAFTPSSTPTPPPWDTPTQRAYCTGTTTRQLGLWRTLNYLRVSGYLASDTRFAAYLDLDGTRYYSETQTLVALFVGWHGGASGWYPVNYGGFTWDDEACVADALAARGIPWPLPEMSGLSGLGIAPAPDDAPDCILAELCTDPLTIRQVTPAPTVIVGPTVLIVTATPTDTPTWTPFPTPTPEVFATGVTNTRLNMRDAPGLVNTGVITVLPVGEALLIDKLTLRFDPLGKLPYGAYLWGYVHSQFYSGWVALARMDNYAVEQWYVDSDDYLVWETPGGVMEYEYER